MDDDQFKKLFKYMQEEFGQVRVDMEVLKKDINRLYTLVDQDLKRKETDEQERLVMGHQLDRHEDWIAKASTQLKITYNQTS